MDSDDEYPSQEDHVFDFAWKGDLALVQQAVAEGIVTLDQRQECDGQTLLHNACEGGRDHVVEWLIGKGANVNAREDRGETPLFFAKRRGCVVRLLEAGADAGIANRDLEIPLHCACMNSSAECATLLIAAHPAGVFALDKDGRTPLHTAAKWATSDVVRLLLDAGGIVDVHVKDNAGYTPLCYALRKDVSDNAELLLIRGARLERVKLDHTLEAIPEWAVSFVARCNACRPSCWAMLELARRRSRVIGGNRKDVLGIVARMVWDSRRDESWDSNDERGKKSKKL